MLRAAGAMRWSSLGGGAVETQGDASRQSLAASRGRRLGLEGAARSPMRPSDTLADVPYE